MDRFTVVPSFEWQNILFIHFPQPVPHLFIISFNRLLGLFSNIAGKGKSFSYSYLKHCSSSQTQIPFPGLGIPIFPSPLPYTLPHPRHHSYTSSAIHIPPTPPFTHLSPTINTPLSLAFRRLLLLFPCWLHSQCLDPSSLYDFSLFSLQLQSYFGVASRKRSIKN